MVHVSQGTQNSSPRRGTELGLERDIYRLETVIAAGVGVVGAAYSQVLTPPNHKW